MSKTLTPGACEKRLRETLTTRFGGVLRKGSHPIGGPEVCALELLAEDMGLGRTDSPEATHTWDLRWLNDMNVPDELRTQHLLPVIAAYAGSMDWPRERQAQIARYIFIATFREIISKYLPAKLRTECEAVKTIDHVVTCLNNIARDLNLARTLDLALDLDLNLARTLDLALALARALDEEKIFTGFCRIFLEAKEIA